MMITYKQFFQKIKVANTRVKMKSSESSEAGFTIIESLMAIVVVSILMTAIAPVLSLSVATRVQARRIELASQAARTYMDGVRAGSIPIPNQVVQLNEVNASNNFDDSKRTDFAGVAAPGSTLPNCSTPTNGYCQNSTTPSTSTASLYCIDRDGGGCTNSSIQDLVIQAFRSTTATTISAANDDADKGYLLAVRVYRADAFNGSSTLKTMKANNSKSATFTGGLGEKTTPLVEIVTEVASKTTKFQDYCSRFGGCQ
jgi:prepilin-type N-terminal cleavage/methylation domain-containing protein